MRAIGQGGVLVQAPAPQEEAERGLEVAKFSKQRRKSIAWIPHQHGVHVGTPLGRQ
jgi:hypothetical protein